MNTALQMYYYKPIQGRQIRCYFFFSIKKKHHCCADSTGSIFRQTEMVLRHICLLLPCADCVFHFCISSTLSHHFIYQCVGNIKICHLKLPQRQLSIAMVGFTKIKKFYIYQFILRLKKHGQPSSIDILFSKICPFLSMKRYISNLSHIHYTIQSILPK